MLSVSPCPAVKTINEELYYTERLLLAIDRGMAELPASTDTSSINARLSSATQTYSRLLDSPVTSLDAFVSEAQVLRFRLGKIYTQINQIIEHQKQFRILVFAGLITLLLFLSLMWGWINARRASLISRSVWQTAQIKAQSLDICVACFYPFFFADLPWSFTRDH